MAPLVIIFLYLWLRAEDRARASWVKHPDWPWNVQTRMAQEAINFQRARSKPPAAPLHAGPVCNG